MAETTQPSPCRLSQQPSWPLRTFAPTAGRGCWRNWRSKIEHDDPRYWMALFTDGGSRYLAIGRTPHKLGVYILDDGNPRPLRMTFPGLSRFPAWLPTYFPLGALPNKIGASTPYHFRGRKPTPYGGLLPVVGRALI